MDVIRFLDILDIFSFPLSSSLPLSLPLSMRIHIFPFKIRFLKLHEALIFYSYLVIDSRKCKKGTQHELQRVHRTMRSTQTRNQNEEKKNEFPSIQNRI